MITSLNREKRQESRSLNKEVTTLTASLETEELHRLRIEADHTFAINAAVKKSVKEAKAAERHHYMGLLRKETRAR